MTPQNLDASNHLNPYSGLAEPPTNLTTVSLGDMNTLHQPKTTLDTTTTQVIVAPSADQIGRPQRQNHPQT